MCGIVGATANQEVTDVIVSGLKTLEYRGYDSAGIAVQNGDRINVVKRKGKIARLEQRLHREPVSGTCGIGHTRWATHGRPSRSNAHPHVSNGSIAVVHNGIIENARELTGQLKSAGYEFQSETDTEVIPHLVHWFLSQGDSFSQASLKAIGMLEGAYAIAITCIHEPGRIIAARKGSPLIVGAGDDAHYVASDVSALLSKTNLFYFLEEGDVASITADSCKIYDQHGLNVERVLHRSDHTTESISKDGFSHFMQKEIFEQPEAARKTLEGRLLDGRVSEEFIGSELTEILSRTRQIHIVACGTSWHAGLVAKYWLESIVRVPCSVEIASEYRYRDPVVPKDTLFVSISQSGETADTLAALRYARLAGYLSTLAICNVENSTLQRESAYSLMTRAGMEIGVASTKALTTQLIVLALLTLKCGELKGIDPKDHSALIQQLEGLPEQLERALRLDESMADLARVITRRNHVLFLGRGAHHPIAQEGALKLKEISYIHAEAYAAGELKHGPLALVDDEMPVIAVCPNDSLIEKLSSNIEEVRARGGEMYVLMDGDCQDRPEAERHFLVELNASGDFASPIVFNVPLQLLAYHSAVLRNADVDQPRNLAKSVTVE